MTLCRPGVPASVAVVAEVVSSVALETTKPHTNGDCKMHVEFLIGVWILQTVFPNEREA